MSHDIPAAPLSRRTTVATTAVPRAVAGAVLATVAGLGAAGCGSPAGPPPVPAPAGTPGQATPRQDGQTRVRVTVGDQRLGATILDSAAGRDLVAQLPLTVGMTDHGAVEKTGPLPSPLSTAGQPDGADPGAGAVGYYAPGNDLVLYYGDQSYHSGIVIIGRLDGGAAGRLAEMDGAVTVTVEADAG